MTIRMVPDIGSPVTVVAVDLLAESFFPTWAEYADYIMTAGGFLAGWMGWGGDYIKNIGVSSLPLTARKIYERVKGAAPVARVARTSVNRQRVTRSYQPEFESTAAHAF